MADEIDKIIKNSGKAELMEMLDKELLKFSKVIVVLVEDNEKGKFTSLVLTLGIKSDYEAYGILEVAKQDLQASGK